VGQDPAGKRTRKQQEADDEMRGYLSECEAEEEDE
jgi:hypothetical protein